MKPILQSSITLLLASLTSATLLASNRSPSAKSYLIMSSPDTWCEVSDPGNLNDAPDQTLHTVSVKALTNEDGSIKTNSDGSTAYDYKTNKATITLHGVGAVDSSFLIGKYKVTSRDYCTFLNAVASNSDPYGLYDERMGGPDFSTNTVTNTTITTNVVSANGVSSDVLSTNEVVTTIVRTNTPSIIRTTSTGTEGSSKYTYSVMKDRENLPIVYVSWFSAARFCNWLNNGQPQGDEGPATTETGAYTLNGAMNDIAGDINTPASNYGEVTPGAKYYLPSENMWVKAAYYKRSADRGAYWRYPTKSNTAPQNTLSGMFDNNSSNCANYFIPTNTDQQQHWYSHVGFTWDYQYANGGKAPFLTPVGKYTGSPGPYGTFDMGGNCYEWTSKSGNNGSRVIRGGSWRHVVEDDLNRTTCSTEDPSRPLDFVGFRVAADPSVIGLQQMLAAPDPAAPTQDQKSLLLKQEQMEMIKR